MTNKTLALEIVEYCETKWSEGRPMPTSFYIFASGHLATHPEFPKEDRARFAWHRVARISKREWQEAKQMFYTNHRFGGRQGGQDGDK